MQSSISQCRYLLSLADPMLADLDDSHLALEPRAGVKTAGWLIGHLAVTGDFARRLCGRSPICSSEWQKLFNPGSHPPPHQSVYPSMMNLREVFRSVYLDLCDGAVNADDEVLAKENPYAPARLGFPTSGEFVKYILTGHLGYHLGQLTAWRATAGLGPWRGTAQ